MKKTKLISLLLCTTLMTSCATIFTGTKATVTINSEPPGAKVQVNGFDQGVTPTTFRAKRGLKGNTVTLKKAGYETRTFDLEQKFNLVSIINLASVVGWGIDLLSGAIMQIDPKQYNITLDKQKK